MEWKTKFEERIAILETKISRLERDMTDTDVKSSSLNETIKKSIEEISKLQTEAEVNELIHKLMALPPFIYDQFCYNFVSNLNCRLTCLRRMNVIPPSKVSLLGII